VRCAGVHLSVLMAETSLSIILTADWLIEFSLSIILQMIKKFQTNLGRAASPPSRQRTTTPQSPVGYNGTPQIHPQNRPFPWAISSPI